MEASDLKMNPHCVDKDSILSSPPTPVSEKRDPDAIELDFPSSNPWHNLSPWRRRTILFLLCAAEFFDVFNASAAVCAISPMQLELKFVLGTISWVLTAYTLTFSSFMLIAGRVADIYDPSPAFCIGFLSIGLFSIPIAASQSPIMVVVSRALQGIGGAMNVPSSMAIISAAYPEPKEKGKALAWFGFAANMGGVVAFVIGGLLAQFASWRWIFYLLTICVVPCSIASWFILPFRSTASSFKWRDLDFPGVLTLTVSLCLFVFSISLGYTFGWATPKILVPLAMSFVVFSVFCLLENVVPNPAFPSRIWSAKDFIPLLIYLFALAWSMAALQVQLVNLFSSLWHDQSLYTALRCAPAGFCSGVTAYLTGFFAHKVPRRLLLVGGLGALAVASIPFALAKGPEDYWTHVFPGILIGYSGAGIALVGSITAVMNGAAVADAGVVGAMMHTALAVGVTIGLTVLNAVTLSVNQMGDRSNWNPAPSHKGFQAGFFSVLGLDGLVILVILVCIRN